MAVCLCYCWTLIKGVTLHVFPDFSVNFRNCRNYNNWVSVYNWVSVSISFVCCTCINLRINHSYYSLYYCILAFTHSCHKLRMSTFNKDQWCYWWWRWLFKVNPSPVTYLIWKTVNNFDGNDDVVLLDCFSGTPYNEKSPRPSISSPLVKPSHTVIISWRRMQSSRVRCAYRGWGTTSATRNR